MIITPETRLALIDCFNERILDPAAYVYISEKYDQIPDLKRVYDAELVCMEIGHACLVIVAGSDDSLVALPFALDPVKVIDPNPRFHQWISYACSPRSHRKGRNELSRV